MKKIITVIISITICIFPIFSYANSLEFCKDKNYIDYTRDKQVLFLRSDLKNLRKDVNKYYKVIQFYCTKLVELDAMKNLKNSFISEGNYTKGAKIEKKKRGRRKKVVNE